MSTEKNWENKRKLEAHFGGGQRSCADGVPEGDSVHGSRRRKGKWEGEMSFGRRDDPGHQTLPYITPFRAPTELPVSGPPEPALLLAVVAVTLVGNGFPPAT